MHAPFSRATLTVVIPTLNEIEALPGNLDRLLEDPFVTQIIVVDGGSTDGTIEYIEGIDHPRLRLYHSKPGRGRQMNIGAMVAQGQWILFHHADTEAPQDAGRTITDLDAGVQWGGFLHKFSQSNWKLRLISALHNWRCRQSGVIYGDQSMFVRADFFQRMGGFVEDGLEDLSFSDQALVECKPHIIQQEVTTESRKFREIGEFRALVQVISIILRYQRDQRIGNENFFLPYR